MLERLTKHWPLKLLALALAISIWASMSGQTRVPRNFLVPLTASLAEGYTFLVRPPTQVDVRLEGPPSRIRMIDSLDLVVRLDLEDLTVGEHSVPLTAAHLTGVPNRVDLVFFNPDRVSLSIDRKLSRRVSVEPNLIDGPDAGYEIYSVRVSPETVMVEGPAAEVEAIGTLRTDPISLESRTQSFTATVSTNPRGLAVDVVDPEPIRVRIVVDESSEERSFDRVPIEPTGEVRGAMIQPALIRATLSGPPKLLDQVSIRQIHPMLDLRAIPADGRAHVVPVALELDLPPEQLGKIKPVGAQPVTVSVRLEARSAS